MTTTARNISSAHWFDKIGQLRGFESSRCYGVTDQSGRMLSMNGEHPSTWGTLRTAKVVAEHVPPTATWIDPVI